MLLYEFASYLKKSHLLFIYIKIKKLKRDNFFVDKLK